MKVISRRSLIKLTASGVGAASLASLVSLSGCTTSRSGPRIIVIGGGFGGSTCAKYLHRFDPSSNVTLIEQSKYFFTCPFSNTVLADLNKLDKISFGYEAHVKRGVRVIHDSVKQVDPVKKIVELNGGKKLAYDKLVVSPGIDFVWNKVEGISAEDTNVIPHAWQAGKQTALLRQQIHAMDDGGVVIIAPPANPFRCPPGPYERASLIAHYLTQHKPAAKILILDAKNKFSKQSLFMSAWRSLYPGMIEWVSADQGGRIERIDVEKNSVYTESGDEHKAAVINFIPTQKAGSLAHRSGLSDNPDGWCPVKQNTFESTLHKDVHVIGDASIAGQMPKSGFSANSQGKYCAAVIIAALKGIDLPEPSFINTCYSLVAPDYGISVAAVYRYANSKGIYTVAGSGGVSPAVANVNFRAKEAEYANGWYASITADAFS